VEEGESILILEAMKMEIEGGRSNARKYKNHKCETGR